MLTLKSEYLNFKYEGVLGRSNLRDHLFYVNYKFIFLIYYFLRRVDCNLDSYTFACKRGEFRTMQAISMTFVVKFQINFGL